MLSARQNKAIELLLQGKSKADVSKEIGISTRQIYNYFQRSEFVETLRQRQGELVSAAAGRGRSRMQDAMGIFESVMNDPGVNPQVRVQAARNLLQFAIELDEKADILVRIERLERAAREGSDI